MFAPFGIFGVTDAMAESLRGTIIEDVLQMGNIATGKSSVNKVKKCQANVFLEMLTEPLPKRVVVVRWGVDVENIDGVLQRRRRVEVVVFIGGIRDDGGQVWRPSQNERQDWS